MGELKLFPAEKVAKMFSRIGEMHFDRDKIRRKFLSCPYGDHRRTSLDIFLPDTGDGPFPILFFLHGGGWAQGDKSDDQVAPFIGGIDRGYAVVSIGYRLASDARYPDILFDVKAALRWVAENADTYLLDAERAALCGASAGGQLALMAAFTSGQASFEGAPLGKTCKICAVVNQFAPTDFLKIHAHYDESGYPRASMPDPDSMDSIAAILGAPIAKIPNLVYFANPIDHVHADVPPVLSQHGRYDPIVPYQQAAELTDKINAVAGEGRAELFLSEDFLHADPGFAEKESTDAIFAFLDKHLRQKD